MTAGETSDDGMEDRVAAAWATVRDGLRRDIGARSFDQWLARMRFEGYCAVDRTVALALPSAFVANWVQKNLADRLGLAWRAAVPGVMGVRIVADDGDSVTTYTFNKATPAIVAGEAPFRFDPRLTFDNFLVGSANRIAHNAARAIAEGGPMRFNPLFVHGPTGQGKTHLLHAIGHGYLLRKPQARALAMSAERFMVDFVQAMRAKDTLAFKSRLRSVDILMIDDFQFIAGKETTQEEFLYTVDELMRGGRRLVISADRSPHELDGIEGRILSRLTQGLVVDIQPADFTLRRAIVEAKANALQGTVIPPIVRDLLAGRIASNIRELEGGLNRLVAYASLNERPIDEAFAEETLADMFRASRRRVTIDEIQRRVADHFKIRHAEMVSARRARVVARPRQIAMYLSKQLTPRSLPEIGRRFGGRDHTTVIHAVKQIERLRAADTEIDADVRLLLRSLEG